jgi:hypothetical protein
MSASSMWIGEQTCRARSPELRPQLCDLLGKGLVVKRYAGNVVDDLAERRVPEVGRALLAELEGGLTCE